MVSCYPKGKLGTQPMAKTGKHYGSDRSLGDWSKGWGPLCKLEKQKVGRQCIVCQSELDIKKRCVVSRFELEPDSCAHSPSRVKCFIQEGPKTLIIRLDRSQEVEFVMSIAELVTTLELIVRSSGGLGAERHIFLKLILMVKKYRKLFTSDGDDLMKLVDRFTNDHCKGTCNPSRLRNIFLEQKALILNARSSGELQSSDALRLILELAAGVDETNKLSSFLENLALEGLNQ
tara:strand:- start:45 stop:740 length:696 start_codon:yes stop_codon:yes gene_type:complete